MWLGLSAGRTTGARRAVRFGADDPEAREVSQTSFRGAKVFFQPRQRPVTISLLLFAPVARRAMLPTSCFVRFTVPRSLLAGALLAAAAASAGEPAGTVRLTPSASLAACPGLDLYKIETAAATYYLEKSGGGLAAMIDREGNDWIGFRPDKGSRAAGEFRGFPNAVHQQAGNYFHPRNSGTDEMKTAVDFVSTERVTIAATGGNGLWAGRYDFHPTHCTFTMTRMSPDHKYWVLYEGPPGGTYEDADWWMTSAIRERQPMTKPHDGDIPAPEWIAFGDPGLKRVLFVLHHEDDTHPDRFYQMDRQMTVFGFGRQRLEKHLATVPQRFSIGFVETTEHGGISTAVEKILRDFAR